MNDEKITPVEEPGYAWEEHPESDDPNGSKKPKKPKNKKLRMGSTATVLTVVFVAAVILLNVVVGIVYKRYPLDVDLTGNKLYTMSEKSEQVAKSIKQDVSIVVFGAESDYANSGNTVLKQLYAFLHRYQSLSDGKVTFKFVDATKQPAEFSKYTDYGVEDGDILFLGGKDKDKPLHAKVNVQDLYKFDQEAYYYYGNMIVTDSYVEKVLAANVQTVSRENNVVVTMLTGHGEQPEQYGVTALLDKNGYSTVETVDFTTATEIRKDSSVLIITAPTEDYSPKEVERLSRWLNNDGKLDRQLVVFTDYVTQCPHLYEFLEEECGIRVEDYCVAEMNTENLFSTQSPYDTYATVDDSEYTTALAADSQRIKLPYCRGITPVWDSDSDQHSSFANTLASFPAGTAMTVPLSDNKQAANAAADVPGAVLSTHYIYDNDTQKEHDTQVLVCGSQLMFFEQYLGNLGNNETFFMGAFNSMVGAEDAVMVPGMSLSAATFEMSANKSTVLGLWVFTIGLPVIMIALGIVVFLRRRHL